jgi:uncharacterized protein YaeQ
MALGATIYRLEIALSDVDRGVYETLDVRAARHPSESMPYLLTRVLAYCLEYAEGIAFSKGLSTTDEPAVWIKDMRGDLVAWIEVGSPSADRLHKASKAAPRVVVFTQNDPELIMREARSKAIFRAERIEVFEVPPAFLSALEEKIDRHTKLELVRTEGQLYVNVGGATLEAALTQHSLRDPAD